MEHFDLFKDFNENWTKFKELKSGHWLHGIAASEVEDP